MGQMPVTAGSVGERAGNATVALKVREHDDMSHQKPSQHPLWRLNRSSKAAAAANKQASQGGSDGGGGGSDGGGSGAVDESHFLHSIHHGFAMASPLKWRMVGRTPPPQGAEWSEPPTQLLQALDRGRLNLLESEALAWGMHGVRLRTFVRLRSAHLGAGVASAPDRFYQPCSVYVALGWMPLHWAARYNPSAAVLRVLLEAHRETMPMTANAFSSQFERTCEVRARRIGPPSVGPPSVGPPTRPEAAAS